MGRGYSLLLPEWSSVMKTRVQLINEAIFHLHTVEEKSVRDIQYELKIRGIELTLLELLNIIASFNYRTVKEKPMSSRAVRREEFKVAIGPLIRLVRKEGITNKSLWNYFEYYNVPGPNSNKLNKDKLDCLILSLDYKYPKKACKYKNIELEEFLILVENELTPEEKTILRNWIERC